ncbi:MAG: HAD family hydrolase [Patescibacteria group bacterium]
MISGIRHIWFDFSDTIAHINKSVADKLMHTAYAKVTKKELTPELVAEYDAMRKKHGSSTAVFVSLGTPRTYLVDRLANIDPKVLYQLADENIPEVLKKLREILPISILSNNRLDVILPSLGIEPGWFTNILGPDTGKKPKPALDGFHMMIELSGATPAEILCIGDEVQKDLVPAKSLGIKTGLLWSISEEADYCFTDFQDILKRFE